MKEIIIIPTFYKQTKFYLRMNDSMLKLGYKMKFFVYKLSLYLLLKKNKAEVILVKKIDIKENHFFCNNIIKNTVEYKTKQMNLNQCNELYKAMYVSLEKNINKENIFAIFIWNGSMIDQKAGSFFAKKYNIKTLYFEIANITGKLFIDKKGTNAQSELYSNIKVLDKYSLDKDEKTYKDWKKIYLESKLKKHIVPQKRSMIDVFQIRYLIDILGHIFITKLAFNKFFIINKLKQIINNIKYPLKYDEYEFKNKKYIFFPLQVSYDSQIMLNSDINLFEAFSLALNYAEKNGYKLVVKPHPQECNYTSLKDFRLFKNKFILMNENTFLLMKYAQEVWTINSTAGLEALIIGKKVKVLGKAIYEKFNEEYLSKYICNYLIDIDFFSREKISKEQVKEILDRIKK